MRTITISENEKEQRLDRFLRKYLRGAALSYIYTAIRKDIKVNGKRAKQDTVLHLGDELSLYMSDDDLDAWTKKDEHNKALRQFKVAYEDDHILAVIKPYGLLTHGDKLEKKNTLANQVITYLIETGSYNPRVERTFTPSPVNRLDRNTTGLVLFGKDIEALRDLTYMIREHGYIDKYYNTIVKGHVKDALVLKDYMVKDHDNNQVSVIKNHENVANNPKNKGGGDVKYMETIARPIAYSNIMPELTLLEVLLVTGRTHQIRSHLQSAGYPIIGDSKYGERNINAWAEENYDLTTQLLHARRIHIKKGYKSLQYLEGKIIEAPLTAQFDDICKERFSNV
ncbi:MAG: RluA family pseudouridine synthase [Clostridiales Family XIII bacterium]|jgi:23S rRNA pseudouridine955/2504/2580 synthase|nr:RluA family pseudouridine synthase [Clostridiales Family XIII bacterium]